MTVPPRIATRPLTVFDLEFTAWPGSMASHWLRPGEFKEVVQIGAVKLDGESFEIVGEFDCLVRPRINPVLSDYFQSLTGITSDRVATEGTDFAFAYTRFAAFAAGGPIAAFGRDDWVLADNIRLHGLGPMPPLPEFFDLRGWFAAHQIDPRGLLSCELSERLGLAPAGRAHNALDDARAIARGMQAMLSRGASRQLSPAA